MMEPCDKPFIAEIPQTRVSIRHFCTKPKDHEGKCVAHGTFNGIPFTVEEDL